MHRIGRTARTETTGTAITFVGGEERTPWTPIERPSRFASLLFSLARKHPV